VPTLSAPAPPTGEWIAIGPASRLLGVDIDTLRRWADAGRIRSFSTPGGHRRFDRGELIRLMSARPPRSLSELGATAARIARVHRRSYRESDAPLSPERFSGRDRAAFRADGRRLVGALLRILESRDPGVRGVAEADAVQAIESTAARLAAAGARPTEVVATYLIARRPFLAELAELGRRRDLDGPAVTALYDQASAVLDRLLLHLVATHATLTSSVPEEVHP
jgi:excisionase family DNA binding protein